MALPTAPSSLDGAGGNSEVDICFSPLLTSLFTDAGKGKGEGMALPTAPSSLDGAGGNNEADICFSPLLASLFTGAGTC